MREFQPDYANIVDAALNRKPKRLPLYEHNISAKKMEEIRGRKFVDLYDGNDADKAEYFREYSRFFLEMGYDTVTFEACVCEVVQGGACLSGRIPGIIRDRKDFDSFDFGSVAERYWLRFERDFRALRESIPAGMRAIGGVGNGIFETVQDFVGYTELCMIRADDPELYAALFTTVGDVLASIWKRFLAEFGDIYCVCRFGDDLGFKSSTLLHPDDIRLHVIPQYRRIVDLVHASGRPFILHSCGAIFEVMDDIIGEARIDAKHSNEDQIAPFPVWVERYGSRIGLFGGLDMDLLCRSNEAIIKAKVLDTIARTGAQKGLAFGSGNSIPDYVPAAGYLAMVNTVRELRGD
jgi:uroporphyrinogen decarboxylase